MNALMRLLSRLGPAGRRLPPARPRQAPSAAADPLAHPALHRMTPHQLADLPVEALRRRAIQDNAPPTIGPAAAAPSGLPAIVRSTAS